MSILIPLVYQIFSFQLAILASYSSDELVAVYRYFRSLAVDSPFSTARDNLIVAFEKVLFYLTNRIMCRRGDVFAFAPIVFNMLAISDVPFIVPLLEEVAENIYLFMCICFVG